jgi:hypothetical protein
MSCQNTVNDQSMEEFLQAKANFEDQVDYNFIQRIIQELTQSCAINLPIPASAIPPLILQAAQYFWENDDQSIEERWYCVKNSDIRKCGPNNIIKLPQQIISVFGVYKSTDSFNYGALGDFSLERIILNNSALAAGHGGSMSNVFGSGSGYSLVDVTAGLYEISTFKAMFDSPITYNYNQYSNDLSLLGSVGSSNLILQVFTRCKIQDLYRNYYFFRYCVCLGMRSMSTIMGTFEFKLPGGVTINVSRFHDMAMEEMQRIDEYIAKNHSADYFFNTCTI